MIHHQRENCILCQEKNLKRVVHLEPTPIADLFVNEAQLNEPQPVFPLDLYFCENCYHIQLIDVIDPEQLFSDYLYETTSSPGLVHHFEIYANDLSKKFGDLKNLNALDIGSNDGTLLNFLKLKGMNVLGVDAAVEIAKKATGKGLETLPGFFDSQMAEKIKTRGKMDIITANNVYAHAENLAEITDGIKSLLSPEGIFIFEVSWLLDLMKNKVFDFIYHEHLCYHSVISLDRFLKQHGMVLFDVHKIPTKGGSIRGYAKLAASRRPVNRSVSEFIEQEIELGLDRPEAYYQYENEINQVKAQARSLVDTIKARGETIFAYGASATATTLIYHFELMEDLDCIVDDNKDRQGLFSPGCHIPVVPPEELYIKKPDHVFITAWRFADAIMKKHEKFLQNGGHFIIPLPELKIV